MRTAGFIKIFFFLLMLPSLWGQEVDSTILLTSKFITAQALQKHVAVLGHDSLEGRATGSEGARKAALYIAKNLDEIGLTPMGEEGTYFQSVPMRGGIPLADSRLRWYSDRGVSDFELGRDYLLYKSGPQTFVPNPVPLEFVGFGIIAPEFDYNDYQALNVEGKIVVFLSGEPHSEERDYFSGEEPTVYSYPEAKQRLAISRGALGSILIPRQQQGQINNWRDLQREFMLEDVTLAYTVASHLSLMMNPRAAARLFENSSFSLGEVMEMADRGQIRSFPLHSRLSFRGEFIERQFLSDNVLAILPGGDTKLKDSYLIVTAHYDHLGIGPPVNGDSIYNGVFDNAAGVSAALEIARAFKNLPEPPKRSVLFLFVTGEEKGLLGSKFYLDHPVVPLYRTIAIVNIDGLAMFETFNEVVGIGAEFSTLGVFLNQAALACGMETASIPPEFMQLKSFARSDQIAFAQAGIPAILIMEGLNYRHMSRQEGLRRMLAWNQNVYHTPFDDLRQPLNFRAAEQHARFLFTFCASLANHPEEVEWYPGTPYINIRLQSKAEKR